ncbi:hypothetical protein JCM11251_000245 [Rhodosporidiobolus azoricus]
MRLFNSEPLSRPASLGRTKQTNERSSAPITFLPLDVLSDILLESLPPPVSSSGRIKEDALQLVRRTKRLQALSSVCKAWRSLLEGSSSSEVAVNGTADLVALADYAKKHSPEASRVKKLLVVGQPSTKPGDETVKTALRTMLKAFLNLRVLCLVEVDVSVSVFCTKNNLRSLFLHDCLIGDDLSYRRLIPSLGANNRVNFPSLTHLTVNGCLFVYRANKYLRAGLPRSGSLVSRCHHNALHNLNHSGPISTALSPPSVHAVDGQHTSSRLVSLPLEEYLSSLSTDPIPPHTALSLSLSAYQLTLPLSIQLSLLRLSPIESLYLDLNNPLEGHVVWSTPISPEMTLGAKAVRQQPGSHEALGLVKELVAILQADQAQGGGQGSVFPQLRKVVLPYSWGNEAVFEEYYSMADFPYHLAMLKRLFEARAVVWEVETMEQATVWGKAQLEWVGD